MVKSEVILRKLQRMDEYLTILRQIKKYSYEEFFSNPERYGSAERFLHLSIEALTVSLTPKAGQVFNAHSDELYRET